MPSKYYYFTQRNKITFIMLFMVCWTSLACNLNFSSETRKPDETEISKSVEETLGAEQTITSEANPIESTNKSPQSGTGTPDVKTTIRAQQETLDFQATLISKPSSTSPQIEILNPTAQPSLTIPATERIQLTDWDSVSFRQSPGCGEDRNGPPCWFAHGDELTMLLRKPVFIDQAWPSPYLIFDQRYVFIQNATIYIKGDGGWEVLWSFPSGQSSLWKPFEVDLSKFKGQEIILQLMVSGRSGSSLSSSQRNNWKIRDPQIVPNYNPD